jgi:hypothetical protein
MSRRPHRARARSLCLLLTLAFLLLPAIRLCAADDGGEAESWTKLIIGGRDAALGGAAGALVGDPFAVQFNPALSLGLQSWHASTQTFLLPDGRNLEYAGLSGLAGGPTGMGWDIDYAQLNSPALELRVANTPQPAGTFGSGASLTRLGFAVWVLDQSLAVGLDLKFFSQALQADSAWGYSEDLGALYRPLGWLDLGCVLENPFSNVSWTTGLGENLPLEGRLSAVAYALTRRLDLGADCEFSAAQGPQVHLGLEGWPIAGILALRAGLDNGQWALGMGAATTVLGVRVSLDYALASDASAAADQFQNRISLDVGFTL